jgi:hypothetical protein
VMQNFQKHLRECVDNKGHHLTDTIFKKWILQLKCFEIKIILVINSCKKIVYFSFYFNSKIVRIFCWTLYKWVWLKVWSFLMHASTPWTRHRQMSNAETCQSYVSD